MTKILWIEEETENYMGIFRAHIEARFDEYELTIIDNLDEAIKNVHFVNNYDKIIVDLRIYTNVYSNGTVHFDPQNKHGLEFIDLIVKHFGANLSREILSNKTVVLTNEREILEEIKDKYGCLAYSKGEIRSVELFSQKILKLKLV